MNYNNWPLLLFKTRFTECIFFAFSVDLLYKSSEAATSSISTNKKATN